MPRSKLPPLKGAGGSLLPSGTLLGEASGSGGGWEVVYFTKNRLGQFNQIRPASIVLIVLWPILFLPIDWLAAVSLTTLNNPADPLRAIIFI